jgi:hypothetical protein
MPSTPSLNQELVTYRNEHGTGFDLIVSAPRQHMVDIEIYQVICHLVPEEPSVSLSLPASALAALMQALTDGQRHAN